MAEVAVWQACLLEPMCPVVFVYALVGKFRADAVVGERRSVWRLPRRRSRAIRHVEEAIFRVLRN